MGTLGGFGDEDRQAFKAPFEEVFYLE